jgi:prevent-host-death family protein
MNKIIGVTELQRQFRTVFDEVVRHHIPYVLTRGSRPEAVLISYEEYVKLLRADETGVIARMNQALERMAEINARHSDKEVEADLMEATQIVRARKRKRVRQNGSR